MSDKEIIVPQAEEDTNSGDPLVDTWEACDDAEIEIAKQQECTCVGSKRAFFTVGILFFINLLNYMDRFTIAGKSRLFRN